MTDLNQPNVPSGPGAQPCSQRRKEQPKSFVEILADELREIAKLRIKRRWQDPENSPSPCIAPDRALDDPDETIAAAHRCKLAGLAFSGGGIRSATFNLGILQGLADLGLLNRFDFLSTVSGGGYIGSWLASWIHRRGLHDVEQGLQTNRAANPEHAERHEIRFLREYSNYLTPRLGFFGADTWTGIVIYLRNTLLNLVILILSMIAVLLLPRIVVRLTSLLECWFAPSAFAVHWLPIIALSVAVFFVAINLRLLARRQAPPRPPSYSRQGFIIGAIVVPLVVCAWSSAAWLWFKSYGSMTLSWEWAIWGAVVYGLMWAAFSVFLPPGSPAASFEMRFPRAIILVAAFAMGALGGTLFWLIARIFAVWQPSRSGFWHMVSFGPPLVILALLLVAGGHIGLAGRSFPDERREWCGRLGAWLLIFAIFWALAFALAIDSTLLIIKIRGWVTAGALAWALSTATGVLGGKNKKMGTPGMLDWKDTALSFAPYIFVVGALIGLSFGMELALAKIIPQDQVDDAISAVSRANPAVAHAARWISSSTQKMTLWVYTEGKQTGIGVVAPIPSPAESAAATLDPVKGHWQLLEATSNDWLWLVFGICLGGAALLAYRVDINEFSMNLLYRNRLVRCYLGATHADRRPNAFTGFDPADDLLMKDLVADCCYSGPYPIINASLNLVAGKDLAWQQRKAESFVITPLHCGFDTWGETLSLKTEQHATHIEDYAYRPTGCYAYSDGGFYLGTALSVSGAAVSPNMGYHSLPALSFLMTVFNVRLGFWAGNPRSSLTWQNPGPRMGLAYLFNELLGHTNDNSYYVYLSDGGHFENLGLYELIKRRCKYIIACDAGADEKYGFGDLAGAIRKCREDMGVEIKIVTDRIIPQGPDMRSAAHCAVGEIHYENVDPGASASDPGILVYIKASLTGDEPVDVLNYKNEHDAFPHDTTADQWFTESQFESYRRLGQHVACAIFDRLWNRSGLPIISRIKKETLHNHGNGELFKALRKSWSDDADIC